MNKITIIAALCVALVHMVAAAPSSRYVHWNKLGASGHPFGRCYKRGRIVPCTYNPGPNNIIPTTRKPWPGFTNKVKPTLGPRFTKTTTRRTTTEKPTTRTTEEPESEQTRIIRERYRIARELSAENLYATTENEAEEFTSRIFDELLFPIQTCTKELPKYTECKIQELSEILQNNKCDLRANFTLEAPATGTGPINQQPGDGANLNLTPGLSVADRRRVRTRREAGMMSVTNSDGSTSMIIGCEVRGGLTKNGHLRMCKACYVQTTLPNR